MSWFNVDAISKGLQDTVKTVAANVDTEKLIAQGKDGIMKLSLMTDEMKAEREKFKQEEEQKNAAHDLLAGMMPWETRDPERDILVEECKEAILKISGSKQNFFGPYKMPAAAIKVRTKKAETESEDDDGAPVTEDVDEDGKDSADQEEDPSTEALERLKTLEPLPARLQEFDLDAHVGLIERLLATDPKLVEMHSLLSGGGERERAFWRNYFFHCAWCRYEAGLSIDEIWSDQPQPAAVAAEGAEAKEEKNDEVTITFEKQNVEESGSEKDAASSTDASSAKGSDKDAPVPAAVSAPSPARSTTESAGFEMVSGNQAEGGAAAGGGGEDEDYELSELEAEIARELEDF